MPKKNPLFRVFIPVPQREGGLAAMHLARAMTRDRGPHEVVIVGTVHLPLEQSLSEGVAEARRRREEVDAVYNAGQALGLTVRTKPRIRVGHVPWDDVLPVIRSERPDLLLIPWSSRPQEMVLGASLHRVLAESPCDLMLVPTTDLSAPQEILLAVRGGGPHAALALSAALALADTYQGWITVLHSTPRTSPAAIKPYLPFQRLMTSADRVARQVVVRDDVAHAIARAATDHTLLILGATVQATSTLPLGQVVADVAAQTERPLLIVARRATPRAAQTARRRAGPSAERTLTPPSVIVDKWFAENTFHGDEFADIGQLVAQKQEQGVTISLGLPTLNEEATIGKIIDTMQQSLMVEHPLLDDIVLIDSQSDDRTVEIARARGIPVYTHQEILPQYGTHYGKGEALWKSLYVLKGDLIAWIDTDIVNIHPRFVYGILGPLLRRQRIQFSKGFYMRPIRTQGRIQASGGGRVTELVARPLLNLFYPELSGLVQPLSGEYAGRRAALAETPFFTGYGVETGMLIHLLERYGLSAIAQVDLVERIHHNQPLQSLSRMAFAIIQVVISRLEAERRVQLIDEVNRTLKLVQYDKERYSLAEQYISDVERPPMITLPEYCAQHGVTPDATPSWTDEEPWRHMSS